MVVFSAHHFTAYILLQSSQSKQFLIVNFADDMAVVVLIYSSPKNSVERQTSSSTSAQPTRSIRIFTTLTLPSVLSPSTEPQWRWFCTRNILGFNSVTPFPGIWIPRASLGKLINTNTSWGNKKDRTELQDPQLYLQLCDRDTHTEWMQFSTDLRYLHHEMDRSACIIRDSFNPTHELFAHLPEGRRLHSIQARITWLKPSFFPGSVWPVNCSMMPRWSSHCALYWYKLHAMCITIWKAYLAHFISIKSITLLILQLLIIYNKLKYISCIK